MAFLQPLPPRQPFFRAPPVVIALLVVLALAHAARVLAPPELSAALLARFAFIPALYSHSFLVANHIDPGPWWARVLPFVTYMGLHNDLTHLAINGLFFLAFAPVVARRFGTGLFLLFFVVCGVAAAATHLALNWGSADPVIGASGAISGLMAAALRLLPTLDRRPENAELMPVLSRQVLLFSLVWVGTNVIVGVTGVGLGAESGLIAWQAHLGGFAAGLLLAAPFDRMRPQPVSVSLD